MKNFIFIIIPIILIIILTVLLIQSRVLYKGPASDHFDGTRFSYKGDTHSFSDMVKWIWEMETVQWPEWIDDPPHPKPGGRVEPGELKVTYINHATLLIQMDGINILTDPIWSDKAGPFPWFGVNRVRKPGLEIADLPQIDVVLISHDHYDHLDLNTLKAISVRHKPKILTGLGVKSLLSPKDFPEVTELDWWQNNTVSGLKITFVPARHGSGRLLTGRDKTLWGGFVIQGSHGNVYFAGDTGYEDFVEEIGSKFGNFRLTLLPLGSYEKRWFMKNQHMNPNDAVKAHKHLNSTQSVGYHFGTFREHPEQTIDAHEKDLSEALEKHELSESRFWILKFGEGRYVE